MSQTRHKVHDDAKPHQIRSIRNWTPYRRKEIGYLFVDSDVSHLDIKIIGLQLTFGHNRHPVCYVQIVHEKKNHKSCLHPH
ncbi:hypothetical protein Hdeb2414_s0004g00134961 [Helianthus debilis subsp. tardiflorus]